MYEMNTIITDFLETMNRPPKVNAGDFYDDKGLLVCGKCKKRKQCRIDNKPRAFTIQCDCELENEKLEKNRILKQDKLERIKELRKQGITDPQYLEARIENDDKENMKIHNAVIRYVQKWHEIKQKNMGILFYGDVGRGKTFYAGCIANMLLDKGVPVIMTNISALITAMSINHGQNKAKILNSISNIPLLVLDDFGVERNSEYALEKIEEIIDTRYRSGKPLIVTTNLNQKDFENIEDLRYKRIYDRILALCIPIKIIGRARRKDTAKKKSEELKQLIFDE